MTRIAAIARKTALPAFALALGLSAPLAGAQAQGGGESAFFVAEVAEAQESGRFAAGGVVWLCEGTQCRAARSTARPLRICRALASKTGTVTSFISDGEAMEADRLERCNK